MRQRVRTESFRRLLTVAAVSGWLLVGGFAVAGERYVVRRDGTRVPVVKSDRELAVTFRDEERAKQAVRQRTTAPLGELEDFPFAPKARVKILRTDKKSAAPWMARAADPGIEEVHPVYRFQGSEVPVASTGTINVRLRSGLSAEERAALWWNYRLGEVETVSGLKDTYVVRPLAEDDDEVFLAAMLAEDGQVRWAEPNFRIPIVAHQVSPQDRYFSRQWHLNNTGQAGGTAGADIKALEAWTMSTGAGIRVSMFDDACDVTHEDLRGGYLGVGQDATLAESDSGYTDPRPKETEDAHGTAVMGLIVARANSVGVRGVAFDARFTATRGLGQALTNAETAATYMFALQMNVDVHNNSWGFSRFVPNPAIVEDAIESAFLQGRSLVGGGLGAPRGMVVVFSAGNDGAEVRTGFGFSTLTSVIGVSASGVSDQITDYSNFGPDIDVMAPGGEGDIATTDNDDRANYLCDGYNLGGFVNDCEDFGGPTTVPDIDPNGLYTGTFSGTSAAAPVLSGVAALVLSANTSLTATDVRLILEHTADRIAPTDAQYDGATGRSLRYGYGRVNARNAVAAALAALNDGGQTWPERVADVAVNDTQLSWRQNGDAVEFFEGLAVEPLRTVDEFLVVESASPISFLPQDGACYDTRQVNCEGATIAAPPTGVTVLAVGCPLVCGSGTGSCTAGATQCVTFEPSSVTKYFVVYARNAAGRYSWGVAADTSGNVVNAGQLPPNAPASDGGGDGGGSVVTPGPKVSIMVSPTQGTSPLTVRFMGNAATDLPIDESRTAWDFDLDDGIAVDATTRNATHTYVVAAGDRRTFMARLTMFDVDGNVGSAQVAIRVDGAASGGDGGSSGSVSIRISNPNTIGSNITQGTSPLTVQLTLETAGLEGQVQSVRWDLGDGTRATSLFVNHTYVNNTTSPLVLPINVTVTTLTSGGATLTHAASRTLTILPGTGGGGGGAPNPIDGVGAVPGQDGGGGLCGVGVIFMLLASILGLAGWRRRGTGGLLSIGR